MMFIIQGIENKKVAEIAKMRDEIHVEVKTERERYEKSLVLNYCFFLFLQNFHPFYF